MALPARAFDRELHNRTWDRFRLLRDDPISLSAAICTIAQGGDVKLARMLRNYAFVAFPCHPALVVASEGLGPDCDDAFYDDNIGGSAQSAEVVLGILREHMSFRRVIDFGAGTGSWLEAARRLGARDLCGVEGPWRRTSNRHSTAPFVFADLNEPTQFAGGFDLVICLEVAEHLRPTGSASFVERLCRCSEVVLFSAALTRQFGDGHINCRPQRHWIELFAAQSYKCCDLFRPSLWYDSRVEPWYRQNTFLFVGPRASRLFASVIEPKLFDIYHPMLLFPPVDHYVRIDHQGGV